MHTQFRSDEFYVFSYKGEAAEKPGSSQSCLRNRLKKYLKKKRNQNFNAAGPRVRAVAAAQPWARARGSQGCANKGGVGGVGEPKPYLWHR